MLAVSKSGTDVTVHAVELKELSAGIEVSVKVLPVPDLSEADVPTPHRSKAVQALLIDVSGARHSFTHLTPRSHLEPKYGHITCRQSRHFLPFTINNIHFLDSGA